MFTLDLAVRRLVGGAALLIAGAMLAHASLVFPSTRITLPTPVDGATALEAEFPFTNSGSTLVTILGTSSTCGCTVPQIAEKTYAPGASGVVKARFEIGGRQGHQTKQVMVRTDSGDHTLAFDVMLPVRLEIIPRLHVFLPGQPNEQLFKVKIGADAPLQKIELGAATPNYEVRLLPTKVSNEYEVHLRLTEDAAASFTETLFVRSTGASGMEYVDSFFIRRAP